MVVGSDSDVDNAMEVDQLAVESSNSLFQKEVWQFRLLPYYQELQEDADNYFSHIKTGLAHSILHRDARPGFIYWICELDRFIQLYSRRFTKTDHINLVTLLHSALTLKNLDFRVVKVVASVLTTLLSRKNLLKRSDLELDWRPLYDLYVEISYKNLEEDGVLLLPENLKKVLGGAILECNSFFSESATQEILDEVRPYMCPLDDSMMRALSILCLFLPTSYKPAEHDQYGAALWYEELWHWFTSNECSTNLDDKIISIFARLAKDCPGYINWTEKFDVIFSRLLRTFKLEVGADRVTLSSGSRIFGSISFLLAYTLGGSDDGVQSHLDQLFLTLESYFYPSNNGVYTTNLLNFVLKLCTNVMYRVSRERFHPERQILMVPTHMQLTDRQIDNFVKRLLPSLKYGAFSKLKQELVPSIMRILSFLSPGIIIPAVLDLVYPALETVTEPHRLIQSLHILACICIPLVRDDPSKSQGERLPVKVTEEVDAQLKSYRCHALSILINILPGIDVNDISKSTLTFQIVGILLLLIPVVDCSEAVLVCNDLTDEEKELCSATAVFDSFVEQLLNKIFAIIEMLGNSAQTSHSGDRQNLTKQKTKSMEEMVIERGVLTVFKALTKNCNSVVYDKIVASFTDFLKQSMFDSKPAMDTITRMTTILVSNKPAYAFPIFFKFASDKLEAHLSHGELFQDEEVDTSVIWYMNLCSEIIRGAPGNVLLQHRPAVEKVVDLVANFKCKDAYYLAGSFSQNILTSLCSIYPIAQKTFELLDQPFDKYLPIRHWAKTMDKKTWSIDWHVPSDGEVQFASDLVQKLVFKNLIKLSNPDSLSDSEMLKCLSFIRFSLEGASNLCPFFDGDLISIMPTQTKNVQFLTRVLPEHVKQITALNGGNLRRVVFTEIKKLADFLLKKRENDTKSMLELTAILKILLHVKGLCNASYQSQFTNFQMTKRILADPLKGNFCVLESVAETVIAFMHARRQLTKGLVGLTATHVEALKLIVRLGTSSYSVVRIESQKILDSSFSWWTYSYKLVIDNILEIINNAKAHTHQQFKGALYMLLNGKELSICVRQDWETLNKVWPSMVKAEHSEKPSIIALLETAHDIIINNFSSFQIYFTFPQSIMPTAKKLLTNYDKCVHKPVWPDLTAEQLQIADALEIQRNNNNIQAYYKLCSEMLKLSKNNSLHWRHVDMAQSFLSLMLRRDIDFPEEAVILFYQLMVSDTIKTRKMAIALMSSWMKIHKPKAIKNLHPIEHLGKNNGPTANWPIQYGFRKDNFMVVYDEQNQPKNAAEWNTTRFFFKVHWGFYTWPKEFKSYASPAEQHTINQRSLSPLESSIVEILGDASFIEKMTHFLSLEEKKGSDQFDPITYSIFYRIFRNFNNALFPAISVQLEKLLKDKREGAQRLAGEIVAGLVNGSKLWVFEKLAPVLEWLKPLLSNTLENMSNECEKNWGTSIATIYGTCDARHLGWLTDILFALIQKPTDNSFHMTNRLYLIHCALNQMEWRIPQQWRKLFQHCSALVGHTYQSMRYRVGSCLASTSLCDLKGIYVDPELRSFLSLVSVNEILNVMNTEFESTGLWSSVIHDDNSVTTDFSDKKNNKSSMNGLIPLELDSNGNKKGKLVLITLVNTLYSLSSLSFRSINAAVIRLIPLLAHYSNESNEEELKNSCQVQLIRSMGTSYVTEDEISMLFDVFNITIYKCCWWKTKMILLRFLQVLIFSNIFVMRKCKDRVRRLVFTLMTDPQLDVRVASADTLSGFIHCSYLAADSSLMEIVHSLAASKEQIEQHAGVLSLYAIIQAFPYSVPEFLPGMLMALCKHAHDPQPNYGTVKKALSEFKRTHQDCWHEHKQEFSEEELTVLTDLLVSPNYYV